MLKEYLRLFGGLFLIGFTIRMGYVAYTTPCLPYFTTTKIAFNNAMILREWAIQYHGASFDVACGGACAGWREKYLLANNLTESDFPVCCEPECPTRYEKGAVYYRHKYPEYDSFPEVEP